MNTTSSKDQVTQYIEKHQDHFLAELISLLKMASVSVDPAMKPQVLQCAEATAATCRRIGLEHAGLIETSGFPCVYADWLHAGDDKPTLLIYGHYDVQPADPIDLWKSPPFDPQVRDGNLYARGATDNKGQFFTHFCAIESLLKTVGKLPVNIKLIIEGEEECGSSGLIRALDSLKAKLKCDAVLVSDTPWYDADHPSIIYSIKGILYGELIVNGPSHDLHSGLFGGQVQNPLQAICQIVGLLKNEKGKILIPGFYDDVISPTPEALQEIDSFPSNEMRLKKELGVTTLVSEEGFSPAQTNSLRPTFDVCGIWGGYTGKGQKTIIPSWAKAKISIRLVANQTHATVAEQLRAYLKEITPAGCTSSFDLYEGAGPLYVDRNHPYIRKTACALEEAFGKKVFLNACGASIPVTSALQEKLKAPVILAGFGLPDDCLHSPNEKIRLSNFFGGIKAAALIYFSLAE